MSNSVAKARLQPESTSTDASASATHWEPKFPFDLVVAYEDLQTRNRALHLYDHLAQQLLDDYDFQCSWWKFDHLINRTLCQQAADAAVDANMVIISMQARPELLPSHQAWLEEWLPRRPHRKSALVALIAGADERAQEAERMLTYLRRAARLAHMDFFNHSFALSLPSRDISLPATSAAAAEPLRVTPPPSVSASAVHTPQAFYHQMPTPRWGINE
jgi:hypothetical protein